MKNGLLYIAEDDPIQQKIIGSVLKSYEPVFFSDGLDLYQKVQEEPPALLILDIIMPSLTGLAITRLLKFDDDYRDIPIIIVSSITESDIEERAMAAGADGFLPKPVNMTKLKEKAAGYLGKA
jgi:CheY-like chemotaxis protein